MSYACPRFSLSPCSEISDGYNLNDCFISTQMHSMTVLWETVYVPNHMPKLPAKVRGILCKVPPLQCFAAQLARCGRRSGNCRACCHDTSPDQCFRPSQASGEPPQPTQERLSVLRRPSRPGQSPGRDARKQRSRSWTACRHSLPRPTRRYSVCLCRLHEVNRDQALLRRFS